MSVAAMIWIKEWPGAERAQTATGVAKTGSWSGPSCR